MSPQKRAAEVDTGAHDSKKARPSNGMVMGPRVPLQTPTTDVDIDSVICSLALPDPNVKVATDWANIRTAEAQVQAYAKLSGRSWTYYVQKLQVTLGRTTADHDDFVDIDLSPSKVVSRKHAMISYNLHLRRWELTVLGRNGVRIDRTYHRSGTLPLGSGNVLDVGGVQMMFVLPDATPCISPHVLHPPPVIPEPTATEATSPVAKPPQKEPAYPRPVAIVSRPQVAQSLGGIFDQDLSADECKDIKPPYSYATMISQAILSVPEQMMSLADIYTWISAHYAFYRFSKPGWQNSIRHNLSLNKAFEKVPRRENEPGKGSKWQIVESFKEEFMLKAQQGKPYRRTVKRRLAKQEPWTPDEDALKLSATPTATANPRHLERSNSEHPPEVTQAHIKHQASSPTDLTVPAATAEASHSTSNGASMPSLTVSGEPETEPAQPDAEKDFPDLTEAPLDTPVRSVEAFTPEKGLRFPTGINENATPSLGPPAANNNPTSSPNWLRFMQLSSTPTQQEHSTIQNANSGSPTKSSPPVPGTNKS